MGALILWALGLTSCEPPTEDEEPEFFVVDESTSWGLVPWCDDCVPTDLRVDAFLAIRPSRAEISEARVVFSGGCHAVGRDFDVALAEVGLEWSDELEIVVSRQDGYVSLEELGISGWSGADHETCQPMLFAESDTGQQISRAIQYRH